ncbi:MAG: hypothetical protein ACXV8P_05015 [Methylobacter sp.]
MVIAKAPLWCLLHMRFASTTISKAFLFIFYPDSKKLKRQQSGFEYAQILIKPSALEFWSSIATDFSGFYRQIYENIGNAQSHSTKSHKLAYKQQHALNYYQNSWGRWVGKKSGS